MIARLRGVSGGAVPHPGPAPEAFDDPLFGDDFHLALYVCYELHYRGFAGVEDGWEWDPTILGFRRSLERAFTDALREVVASGPMPPEEVVDALRAISTTETSPSLTRYIATHATADQARELLIHRSVYHLKEADPHTWALPRLSGRPKVALAEIQNDEYGSGRPDRLHARLFGNSMIALGLDATYGAYVDAVPGVSLGAVNLMSLFGLHRRWRGATAGHLALFEMTSSEPNRRLGDGLRRLGFGHDATAFFDEHVEADSIHEVIALHDLAGALAVAEPDIAGDIVFGARALDRFDHEVACRLVDAWSRGRSSLMEGARSVVHART
ncbi:MAG: iron-containing redox enzyme family protein [Actinomycetota bacterium]|nr:iron-containing redox enzyme family protein [Actinomycetota bacterium]